MTRSASSPVTVLVVEDDPELQYLLGVALAEEGRRVLVAPSASEARSRLAAERVDLMVLDLILPDADGRTLLAHVRSAPGTASIPVLVLTSRVGKDVRAECYELGADAFVEKPFDPEALAAEVTARLGRAADRARQALVHESTGLRTLPGLLTDMEAHPGASAALVVVEVDGLRALASRQGGPDPASVEKQMAAVVAAALAPHDVARVGPGEFAVLIAEATTPDPGAAAPSLAQAAVERVREAGVQTPDGEFLRLTASAAWSPGETGPGAAAWLEEARALANRASERGGNRWVGPEGGAPPADARPLVLVAEDDDITATILTHRLEREGFQVARFDNGQDAYREALRRTPDLVVLDVKMPGMDGFELLERLRRTPSYATVPVMMLTSLGSEADVVRGFALGADDYMPKPFSPTELLARLRRLLRQDRGKA